MCIPRSIYTGFTLESPGALTTRLLSSIIHILMCLDSSNLLATPLRGEQNSSTWADPKAREDLVLAKANTPSRSIETSLWANHSYAKIINQLTIHGSWLLFKYLSHRIYRIILLEPINHTWIMAPYYLEQYWNTIITFLHVKIPFL